MALVGAAVASAAAMLTGGLATLALGRRLRRRALAGVAASRRTRGMDIPAAIGRVLDLEQFETVAPVSGVVLALATLASFVAVGLLTALGHAAAVAVLVAALAVVAGAVVSYVGGVSRWLRPGPR